MEKKCAKCQTVKPLTEFHKAKRRADGVTVYCKACEVARRPIRWRNRKPPSGWVEKLPPGMKQCSQCHAVKALEDFGTFFRNADGKEYRCKQCHRDRAAIRRAKDPEKHRAINRRDRKLWYDADPKRARNYRLRAVYGVALTWFDETLTAQGGACAICGTDNPGGKGFWHVDHNHATGVVRGLLCSGCNIGLGHFRESVETLKNAVLYLSEYGG